MRWVTILSGLLLALASSVFLLLGLIRSGPALALGVLGIGLISISDHWKVRK